MIPAASNEVREGKIRGCDKHVTTAAWPCLFRKKQTSKVIQKSDKKQN